MKSFIFCGQHWSSKDISAKNLVTNIVECDKYRHLKCVKATSEKKGFENFIKNIWESIFVFNVVIFNSLFHSVGLRHMFLCNILLAMDMYWGSRYCIYATKCVSAWASEGGGGLFSPWILKFLLKKVVFLVLNGKKQISPLSPLPLKNFGKFP